MRQKHWTLSDSLDKRSTPVGAGISPAAPAIHDPSEGHVGGDEQAPMPLSLSRSEPLIENGRVPSPDRPSEDAMFPLSHDGIVTLGITGDILQANQTFRKQLGTPERPCWAAKRSRFVPTARSKSGRRVGEPCLTTGAV